MDKWTRPSHYIGAEWPEYFVFLSQNRDSDALTRSNFRSALAKLGGETGEVWMEDLGKDIDMILIVRESHFACGWVEWIAIHESNTAAIAIATQIESDLEQYPVVDESNWSEVESEECEQVWSECYDPSERIQYLRKHSYTASSLTDILQAVRAGSWYHAANMLHSPSDILY